MASIVVAGDTSGTVTLAAPAVSGTTTLTLPTTSGTVLTSASTQVTGPAFSAYGNAAQSFTSGVWTKVQFNIEDFDTNSNYDNTTNYRFTPTVAGYYQINACSSSSGTGTSGWATAIYKNGTGIKYAYVPNASIGVVVFVASLIYCNGSTDYIEIYAVNNNTTQNNQVGQTYSYFNGAMVRSA